MKHNIIKVYTREYRDNGQIKAYVEWADGSRTEGEPEGAHMQALFARAEREGLEITKEVW